MHWKLAFVYEKIRVVDARCSFSNLSPAGSELIQTFLRKRHRSLLEGTPDSRPANKPAAGVASFTPKPEPQTDTADSTLSIDASTGQLAKSSSPSSPSKSETLASQKPRDNQEPAKLREAPANVEPQSNRETASKLETTVNQETAGNQETAASQWESTQSIQPNSEQNKNSARYVPAVVRQNTPSRTIIPQPIVNDPPETAAPQTPFTKPAIPSTPAPQVETPEISATTSRRSRTHRRARHT